jgi:hypothetical protein
VSVGAQGGARKEPVLFYRLSVLVECEYLLGILKRKSESFPEKDRECAKEAVGRRGWPLIR